MSDDSLYDAIEVWADAHKSLKASEDELQAALVSLGPEGCESRARHLVGCWRRMERAKNALWLAVHGVEFPQRAVEGEE
jgi:hypothetical protein